MRTALGLADDTVAVLYLGQLEPRKDPATAVRAAVRAHRDDSRIVLLIAGEGPATPSCKRSPATRCGCSDRGETPASYSRRATCS